MTTYYAAAKYEVHAPPEKQWRELSDLTMVAVELVRIAWALGHPIDAVIECFEEGISAAEYEWDEYSAQEKGDDERAEGGTC